MIRPSHFIRIYTVCTGICYGLQDWKGKLLHHRGMNLDESKETRQQVKYILILKAAPQLLCGAA